ncbi:MAG: hypothetical protein K2P22_06710, partial [Lachnospiraceae bacterium]|nr:hypothetical protein [Lachnospiraceae bacterium]
PSNYSLGSVFRIAGSEAKIYVNQIATISLQLQNYMIGSVMVVRSNKIYKAINHFTVKTKKSLFSSLFCLTNHFLHNTLHIRPIPKPNSLRQNLIDKPINTG